MAQETNILVQVSDDGANWTDLVILAKGTVSHKHTGLTLATTKYYRTIAKGDGVNTLDSPPSQVVSVATGFVTEYQAVLDQMTIDGVSHPSFTQNVLNDIVVRNLLRIDKWKEFDVLYYFQQEAGTPYEALTYNWKNPAAYRLTNLGTNDVDFIGGSGLSVTGGNSQYMSLNFNPSTDGVKFLENDAGVFFSLFNIPATYSAESRILGGASVAGTRIQIGNTSSGVLSALVFGDSNFAGAPHRYTTTQNALNKHHHISITNSRRVFVDGNIAQENASTGTGTGVVDKNLHLFGIDYLGTPYPSEGTLGLKYLALGSNLRYYDKDIYDILTHQYSFESTSPTGTIGFTTAATSGFPSLYYPKVLLAEPFKPYFSGITKKYIVLYSTNHATSAGSTPIPSNGAIGWGECDHPNLDGYVDRGIIIAGYQSEAPSMIINTNDPNGHHIWFFYHPDSPHPDSGGYQQTRLLTTSGGVNLHDATYADRGKILGFTSGELALSTPHSGYADPYVESDGSITVIHITKNWSADTIAGVPNVGKSTCPGNSYVFTRVDSDMDITSFMPYFRMFHQSPSLFFIRNAVQYAVARNITFVNADIDTNNHISVFQCDGDYHPTVFLGNISAVGSGSNTSNAGYFIDEENAPDTLNIYFIDANRTDMHHTTWDLKNLD